MVKELLAPYGKFVMVKFAVAVPLMEVEPKVRPVTFFGSEFHKKPSVSTSLKVILVNALPVRLITVKV